MACQLARRVSVASMIRELSLKIANERDSELDACEFLDEFAKKCDFMTESIDEMRLAFIEAIINAKEHAPKNLPTGVETDVFTAFSFDGENLTIQVRDFGQGFNPTQVEKPDIKKKLKSANKRGWGLMLMEKLMDGVEISSFPPSGTLIKMVKKRVNIDPPDSGDLVRERKRIERLKYILGSFIDLSSFLCQNRDLETGLRSMLRILLGTLGVSRGAIYIADPAKDVMQCVVDIKLRAKEKFPLIKLSVTELQNLSGQESLEVSSLIARLNPAFFQTFTKEEAELVYLLKSDVEILGMLVLGARFRVEDNEPYDGDLLSTLARNISSAINTFKLMEQLKSANGELDTRVQELSAVREASQTISSELEMENLPFTVERIFQNIMKIGKFSLSIHDPSENRYTICQTGRELPQVLDLWSSPISRYVVQKMTPIFVPDIEKEKRFQFPRAKNYRTRAFIVIPVVVQEEALGLVSLTDRTDGQQMTDRDFNLAQLLCTQLGIALKNANLYKLGITDGLTHLYTQHYLKMRLSQEISRLRRVKSPLSLIVMDMDNFKSLNEAHGDFAGDTVLSKVSNTIKRQIRFNDIPCRRGGEKFAIILPDTHLRGAVVVAEKLRAAIETSKILHHAKELKVTASFGVAPFEINMSLEQLLESGDCQLREAKAKGGNFVSNPEKASPKVSPEASPKVSPEASQKSK